VKPGQTRWTRTASDLHDEQAVSQRGARDRHHQAGHGRWLTELRRQPQSAKDLAVTLGQPTSRRSVSIIRGSLESMERAGMVRRTRPREGGPYVWEAL
jgi:hypothetical protein